METEFAIQLSQWISDYMHTHDITVATVIGSMELVKKDIIDEAIEE